MTDDQLAALLDRACRGVALTPVEGEQLRAAVAQLQQQAEQARRTTGGLQAKVQNLSAQLAALHEGEEPHDDEAVVPTPAQWIWRWNRATPQRRQELAALIRDDYDTATHCRIYHPELRDTVRWQRGQIARYRAAWHSARKRAHHLRCILADYRVEADAQKMRQAACDHRDPNRLGAQMPGLATVCACGHMVNPPIFGSRAEARP